MNKETCSSCAETKQIVQTWLDEQGHDRCWYYPDLFLKLVKLFGLSPKLEPKLPPRKEFEAGCARYQDEEYGAKK